MTAPLWAPDADRIANTRLTAFEDFVRSTGLDVSSYPDVHRWSVERPDAFWSAVWDFAGVVADVRGERAVEPGGKPWETRFFPDARLSFARNLLRRDDDQPAMIAAREDGSRRTVTWAELHALVSRLQQALLAAGVGPGDRVAAWLPNAPEAYALLIATASIGAVFSSTSPDFGTGAVVDRFGQISPRVLVACDGYLYNGRRYDCRARVREVATQLPTVTVVPVLGALDRDAAVDGIPHGTRWDDWLAPFAPGPVDLPAFPFDQPLAVLFSSGTTGPPKCIVHRAGGVLLKHVLEHQLHCDIHAGDHVCYFTTTGWMMFNWLASALASEATLVLYDGSPVHPSPAALFDLADETGLTLFGTSAKYLTTLQKLGIRPREGHHLTSLRTITSTGSPLSPEGFAYVYEHVKRDVHLASISGGTDLCGCLVAGDPTSPVWAGEIQRPGLGMAIAVLDDAGNELGPGPRGELVCRSPFPSMPLGLWNDPDGSRFRSTYYARFPGAWHQGDFAHRTEHGGFVIHGRSDATLNPGGVRIGTAEIYRQVQAVDEVVDSLAIGQEWDGDTRVVLFVVLRPGVTLDAELQERIREKIRTGASPRHVPARIVAVPDLPRTRNDKLAELAVRDVVHGRTVGNAEALANPEALAHFRDLEALRT